MPFQNHNDANKLLPDMHWPPSPALGIRHIGIFKVVVVSFFPI